MKKLFFTLMILISISSTMYGKIILPSVFADNMVLQQKSNVAIWGWSDPGETVKIVASWNSKDTVKVKADNTSAWKTTISTIGAGGPYTIQILGSSKEHGNECKLETDQR
jgi:sialate O-acetylesterase